MRLPKLLIASRNHSSPAGNLIVEFQRSAVRISQMHVSDSGCSHQRGYQFNWPGEGDIPWNAPEEVVTWLQECTRSVGLQIRSAIVCVPRTSTCLRVIEIPSISDEQLPSLVAMQLENAMGDQATQVEYDFARLTSGPGTKIQSVLLATITKSTIHGIREILRILSCKIESITLGELAIGLASQANNTALQFLTIPNNQQWDVAVCQAGVAVQFQSTSLAASASANARSVLGLINRLRTALPSHLASYPSESPVFIEDTDSNVNRELIAKVSSELDYRVRAVSRSECIWKMVYGGKTHSINFAQPWRAPDLHALSRKRWTMFAVTVAAAAAVALFWAYVSSVNLNEEQKRLQKRIAALEEELQQLEPNRATYRSVRDWKSRETDWGIELTKLAKRLREDRELYIARIQMEASEGERPPTIRIDGLATTVNEVLKLNRNFLSDSARYAIQPQGIEPSIADPQFPLQFRIEAKVLGDDNKAVSTDLAGVTTDE